MRNVRKHRDISGRFQHIGNQICQLFGLDFLETGLIALFFRWITLSRFGERLSQIGWRRPSKGREQRELCRAGARRRAVTQRT